MDLPLAVLLSDALVGGEPRQGGLQRGQAVAGGQADEEQLTCLLGHTEVKHRGTLMRDRKQTPSCVEDLCGSLEPTLSLQPLKCSLQW